MELSHRQRCPAARGSPAPRGSQTQTAVPWGKAAETLASTALVPAVQALRSVRPGSRMLAATVSLRGSQGRWGCVPCRPAAQGIGARRRPMCLTLLQMAAPPP